MGAADRRRRALLRILVLSIVVAGLTTAQTADPDTDEMTAMKVLKYDDEYLVVDGGTCGYGPIYGNKGVVMAANTAFYSGDLSQLYHHDGLNGSPNTRADGCGVCYEVTGPGGTATAIIADICDNEADCTQFVGSPSFNLYDRDESETQVWDEVMGASFGAGTVDDPTGVTLRKVSCPTAFFDDQPVGLKWKLWNCCESFNSGNGENGGMEWTVINHRTQILSLEVRNAPGGDFVALNRKWQNAFEGPFQSPGFWTFADEYTIRITADTGTYEITLDGALMIDDVTGTTVLELGVNDQLGRPYEGTYFPAEPFQFPDYGDEASAASASAVAVGSNAVLLLASLGAAAFLVTIGT